MLRIARRDDHRALIIQQLRDGFLRRICRCKSAIEDVSLPLDFSGDRLHANRDADDAVGKSDSLQVRAYQSHPRLVAGRRSRGSNEMLEGLAIGEREDHRHLARALAARLEIRRDVSDERVDDENQTLRILEGVLHPVERSGRQRPRHAGEDAARVVGSRQSPEARSFAAETNLYRLEVEPRQIPTALDSDPIEQRRQKERWLEHTDGKWSQILPLRTRRDSDETVLAISVTSRDLGADGSDGGGCPYFLDVFLVKDIEKISRQRLGAHPARIGPDDSICSQHHTRSYSEQRRNQSLKEIILPRDVRSDGGRIRSGGGSPKTDESHFFQLETGTNHVPKIYRKQEGRPMTILRSMHARLAETMTFVEEKRRELMSSFEGVDGERLCRQAAPGVWSVAQILEHLRIVESNVAQLITKRVAKAKAAGIAEENSTESVLPSFEPYRLTLENAVISAPEMLLPRSDIDINEALEGLESSREALRAAAVSANGLSLGEIKHTHRVLGEIDLYQWLIFVGHHEARHKKQIERTLKSIPS